MGGVGGAAVGVATGGVILGRLPFSLFRPAEALLIDKNILERMKPRLITYLHKD